jgi:hypothetical protein
MNKNFNLSDSQAHESTLTNVPIHATGVYTISEAAVLSKCS